MALLSRTSQLALNLKMAVAVGALPRVSSRCCSWRNPAPVRRAVWARRASSLLTAGR